MSEVEQLRKELAFYKEKFSIAEHDVAVNGFIAYVKIVKQMVEYIQDFDIKTNIEGKKSENAMYERTEKIWGELPDMISKMNRLKTELGIEYNPEEGMQKMKATTPETMAQRKG